MVVAFMRASARVKTLLPGYCALSALKSACVFSPIGVPAVPLPSWQATQWRSNTCLAWHHWLPLLAPASPGPETGPAPVPPPVGPPAVAPPPAVPVTVTPASNGGGATSPPGPPPPKPPAIGAALIAASGKELVPGASGSSLSQPPRPTVSEPTNASEAEPANAALRDFFPWHHPEQAREKLVANDTEMPARIHRPRCRAFCLQRAPCVACDVGGLGIPRTRRAPDRLALDG